MKLLYAVLFAGLVLCFCLLNIRSGYAGETGSQFLLGLTSLDKNKIDFKNINGVEDADLKHNKLNLSDLISIGGAGYTNLTGDKIGMGVEYGAIFSGMSDKADGKSADGLTNISADGSIFLLDLFLGPQINTNISNTIRLYCGAGPLLMCGYVSGEFKQKNVAGGYDVNENDTAVGLGGYIRAGVDFSISRDSSLGVGARGFTTSSLDFNNTLGSVNLSGTQVLFSYTSRF